MSKFLHFWEIENSGKKTKRWVILNQQSRAKLGWIEFHTPWRKYVWSAIQGVIFDVACTQDIVDFLNEHKDDRN